VALELLEAEELCMFPQYRRLKVCQLIWRRPCGRYLWGCEQQKRLFALLLEYVDVFIKSIKGKTDVLQHNPEKAGDAVAADRHVE